MLLQRAIAIGRETKVHQLADTVTEQLYAANHTDQAVEIIENSKPELILIDGAIKQTQKADFFNHIKQNYQIPIVIVNPSENDYTEIDTCNILEQNNPEEHLKSIVKKIKTEKQSTPQQPQSDFYLNTDAEKVGFIGKSKASIDILKKIKTVALSNCNPVLITGETGTGKEIAARAVHKLKNPGKPFVALNCASLTAHLLESELFGHTKGAFTGANCEKQGLIEAAQNGTLFLDEISEMPGEMQAKLLRLLQEKTYRKVGATKTLKCRATIIASSNRLLKKAAEQGSFRKDLYYRLNIFPICLKPLRSEDRREEITTLAKYFIQQSDICPHKKGKIKGMTKMAEEALTQYDWHGNIRELKNVIERAVMLENTEKIGLSSLSLNNDQPIQSTGKKTPVDKLKDFSLEKAEHELIARALQETGWQKTRAAALLGITRATLYTKVKQYNIKKEKTSTVNIPDAKKTVLA